MKPIAREYYVFDVLFAGCSYYVFARVNAYLQPGKLVPGQAAVQVREYYGFSFKHIHIINITILEQTSAGIPADVFGGGCKILFITRPVTAPVCFPVRLQPAHQ